MSQKRAIIRWIARVISLLLAVVLLMAGPIPEWILKILHPSEGFVGETILLPVWMAKIVPSASPLSFISSIIAHRTERLIILWSFPALIIMIAAFLNGRFFCRWICPLGTIYAIMSRKSFNKHFLHTKLSGYLFWGIIFSSVLGFPLLLFSDPLSCFSRINMYLEGSMTLASLIPGTLVPIFLIASIFQPVIWCVKICPLGYMFDFLHRTEVSYSRKFKCERRQILTGLFFAIPMALIIKKNPFVKDRNFPLLPPGAKDKETFSSLCTRCYACVNVCPTRILTVDFPSNADISRWFLPEMNPYKGTCQESCNNCTQVCPTGAITRLSFDEKHRTQIGIAKVIKTKCIAWKDGEYCVVCNEFCPYQAISIDQSGNGLPPRPVVNPEKCRGCGICQNACPVRDKGAAIVVTALKTQNLLNTE